MKRPSGMVLKHYYNQALGRATKLLGPHDPGRKDLAQEIMVSFVRGIKIFRHDAELDTLFYIVCKRREYDHLRTKYRGERKVVELALYRLETLLEGNKNISPTKKRNLITYRSLLASRQEELRRHVDKKKNGGKK